MAGSAIAEGVRLHHIARETSDVERLAAFYAEVLGFERVGAPKFGDFAVAWLRIPRSPLSLHIIERNPQSKLPVSPYAAAAAAASAAIVADPKALPRGHHVSFAVSNYDAFVRTLKVPPLPFLSLRYCLLGCSAHKVAIFVFVFFLVLFYLFICFG